MSDTSPFGFGKFVPGFDFLQNLAKGSTGNMPQMPNLSSWVAPTISVEELEKRITELKAERKKLDVEMEFYKKDPAKAPAYVRRQLEENAQSQAVQRLPAAGGPARRLQALDDAVADAGGLHQVGQLVLGQQRQRVLLPVQLHPSRIWFLPVQYAPVTGNQ